MSRPKRSSSNRLFPCLLLLFFLAFTNTFAQDQPKDYFYFVQITDTHLDDGDHLKKAEKIVEQINKLPMKIECVVHTGDITNGSIENTEVVKKSLSVFSKLTVPVHYLPGNNDILTNKLESTTQAYIKNFGKLISTTEYQNVAFLFVYTEPLSKSFSMKGYDVLKQVKTHLEKLKGTPVILFHHSPCVSDFYNNAFHDTWNMQTKNNWVTLINSYNVKAVIAGHFHRAEQHWLGNVPLYVAPPVAGYWGRQASFRIYEYHNGKIEYRTQYIE